MILYSEKHPFVARRHPLQLGWILFNKDTKERLVHTSSKDTIKEIWNDIDKSDKKQFTMFRKIPKNFEPKLLVVDQKHGNLYFLIKNEEEFQKQIFNYIKENLESEHGGLKKWELTDRLKESKGDILTEEEIEKLPNNTLKQSAREFINQIETELINYKTHNDLIESAEKLIKEKNYKHAWFLFQKLRMLYYEFNIVDFYE